MITDIIVPTIQQEWDQIEIHPCKEAAKGVVEQCEDKDAEFYSVYVHLKDGGLECIADCADLRIAHILQILIETLIKTYKP